MPVEQVKRVLGDKTDEKLLTLFFVLYKTSRIIDSGNAVFKNQSETFFNYLTHLVNEYGNITLKAFGGHYFVNERMVKFDEHGASGAAQVVAEWKTLGIGGITFEASATLADIRQFITFIAAIKPNSSNIEELAARLKTQGHAGVHLLSLKREGDQPHRHVTEEEKKTIRLSARNAFFQAMTTVQELVVNVSQDREINMAKTRRVVQALIDHVSRDESSLLELASIRDYDDYTYAHSTNVCVYSLTLGARLGLDRSRLSQLGFTALFHDIGKVKLPKDLIRKPDAYDENDWIQMQRHPQLGAKTILARLKLDEHTARAARGAFEHHINSDFTGYPTLHHKKRTPDLFSRIISIVDTFDALSSGRVYLKKSIAPDEVIKKMRSQMAIKFDPFLLKIFTNVVGIYPSGSLVLLSTNEIALVLTNNEQNLARPYIKIVGNRAGLLDNPIWIDLALPENEDRKVMRMIDPSRYGLDVKNFILQD
ncbi:MAG: HD domain-containing protein [bacterium]|nr:HD domain-containing protein [bacterium]